MMTPEQAMLVFTDCKRAYQLTFRTAAGKAVLVDLAKFCRANETCIVPGDRDRTCILGGRHETYLMILDYINLTPEQLVEKYTRPAKGAISHDDQSDLA